MPIPRWGDDRLDDKFKALDDHVRELRDEIRVFAPTSIQLGVLEHKVDAIEHDIAALEQDVRASDVAITDILRSSRADTVRLALVLVGPLIALIIAGLATGRI